MSKTLDKMMAELEQLRRQFELYFMGIEKRQPIREREQVSRRIKGFQPGNNTVERFRAQGLQQRLMTLERYWNRTLKAIEEGRYERDIRKADYRESKREKKPGISPARLTSTVS